MAVQKKSLLVKLQEAVGSTKPLEVRLLSFPQEDAIYGPHTYIAVATAKQFEANPKRLIGMHVKHTRMVDCCGISILSYLGGVEEMGNAETRVLILKLALEQISKEAHTGGVIVTTAEYAQPNVCKALLEAGFKEVARSGNTNSDHVVTTFFYTLTKPEDVDEPDYDY